MLSQMQWEEGERKTVWIGEQLTQKFPSERNISTKRKTESLLVRGDTDSRSV
jgi:hypothetical protein